MLVRRRCRRPGARLGFAAGQNPRGRFAVFDVIVGFVFVAVSAATAATVRVRQNDGVVLVVLIVVVVVVRVVVIVVIGAGIGVRVRIRGRNVLYDDIISATDRRKAGQM